jgi:pilus assembly protein Flp/PilA
MLDLISTAITQLRQRDREDGQAMVEYALILALVSIAAITVLGFIGTDVNTVFTNVDNALKGA